MSANGGGGGDEKEGYLQEESMIRANGILMLYALIHKEEKVEKEKETKRYTGHKLILNQNKSQTQ